MFLVRSFGVKLYKKGWKNLNAIERFMAEWVRWQLLLKGHVSFKIIIKLCLNSIVDLHDNQLMKAVGLDVQAIQDFQTKFMISNLTCPNVDKEVQQLMKKADKVSRFLSYLIFKLKLKYQFGTLAIVIKRKIQSPHHHFTHIWWRYQKEAWDTCCSVICKRTYIC